MNPKPPKPSWYDYAETVVIVLMFLYAGYLLLTPILKEHP